MSIITRLPSQRSRHTAMSTVVPFSRVLGFHSAEPRLPVTVPGIDRQIVVEIAAARRHWDAAFRLVQQRYEAHGYATPGSGPYRFAPGHALPNTAVLIAREHDRVLATMSLFLDSPLLGLPSDSIYGADLDQLRRNGRRLAEGGNLADRGIGRREFLPVFIALNRLAWQYGISQGVDTVTICSTPRHGVFYRKLMGYIPLGPARPYPYVEDTLAQAYWLDVPHLKAAAPDIHRQMLGTALPAATLAPRAVPDELVRYFGSRSSLTCARSTEEVLKRCRKPRRWCSFARSLVSIRGGDLGMNGLYS